MVQPDHHETTPLTQEKSPSVNGKETLSERIVEALNSAQMDDNHRPESSPTFNRSETMGRKS